MGRMANRMNPQEWRAFLSSGTRTAKVATVNADGAPHLAPVWFVLDGDELVFSTGASSVKGRNLARDGRVTVCVDDERPPFAFVVVHGRARLDDDPEAIHPWAVRIAARYMGEDLAEQYGARNSVPGELLVRVRIESVTALSGVAD